ncbi:hypothetical protein [Paracidobacterium acidisoli]|uniref:DUF4157 domain-containing protein n=1 Tax=Paracidobacterium acidisoli TaxID=2303751 RepID=A0A372IJS7_9BACT|nr:hypothetical protein [Paracidobacterium acidisoli]MBT9333060.1 hypothetical protein [Paracidobacterium acidisoli]
MKGILPVIVLGMTAAWGTAWAGSVQQQAQDQTPDTAQTKPGDAKPQEKTETHITPAQAKELFASVDTIMQFASQDSKLPIKHEVKRKLTTRAAVEGYLVDKMKDDKDAKRMERSEIVLKKFGLLDQDFRLEPFLVSLLKEQIAGYYDNKTKTVNLLDWIEPETQKPVLAHELTHALQDQHVNLDKWEDQSSEDISRNAAEDLHHVSTDEVDTAREAVLEGQAMAVFLDYGLAPTGRHLQSSPELVDNLTDNMADDPDSPVLSRAPLLLQESLLFPYRDGLKFEATLLTDKGQQGAFAAVLDHPPATSYEIMNPKAYERGTPVPLLHMPDVHPILDTQYDPYDIGVMGELDVQILSKLFGGDRTAALLTPAWDGGIYYASQKKDAPDKDSTASIALMYLSQWKSPQAAALFVKMYADELGKKYANVQRDPDAEEAEGEQAYKTSEGPVLMVTSGRDVFISESYDLTTARKLQLLMLGAQQGSAGQQVASSRQLPVEGLTGSMVHFLAGCGMMKVALPH